MAAAHLLVPPTNTVEREEEVEVDGEVEERGLSSTGTSWSRVEKEEVGKEKKSVYFDSGEGTRLAEENDVENSKPLTNGVINHPNGHEAEKQLEFDNGVHAGEIHHAVTEIVNIETSVVNKEVRFSSHQSEIKSEETIGEVNGLNEEAVEYDVEKVLEEQETHDLFCPKCQSCITKRVILRKRKRIGKPLQSESKRGKLPDEGIDVHDDVVDPSTPDPTQQRVVFRCLECLSFFFSTDSGLKIFRIFGRKDEVSSQQSSIQTPPFENSNSIGSSSVIAQKPDESSAAHGFEFFRFLGRKYEDQKLEKYEQDTATITNIGGLISDGLDSSKSSTVESAEGVKQLDRVRQLLPESIQVTSLPPIPGTSTEEEHRVDIVPEIDDMPTYDVLKSIVYGGLVELITSLGVISSAAGSNSTTLNIVVLALANLVGGLTVLAHNLKELISGHKESDQTSQDEDRYFKTLGLRANYRLHIVVSIISYIIFGLLPPIIYGFSFRKSDGKNYKLIAVAGASLFCILLLAIGKAHVQQSSHKPYIKTAIYYLATGFTSSGLSYAVGDLLRRALEETGLFDSTTGGSTPSSSTSMIGTWSPKTGWEAY